MEQVDIEIEVWKNWSKGKEKKAQQKSFGCESAGTVSGFAHYFVLKAWLLVVDAQ